MSDVTIELILVEVTLPEAMEHFLQGRRVYVDWERRHLIEKDNWCEININDLQRGNWFVEQTSCALTTS
jgi:hypothetical protein